MLRRLHRLVNRDQVAASFDNVQLRVGDARYDLSLVLFDGVQLLDLSCQSRLRCRAGVQSPAIAGPVATRSAFSPSIIASLAVWSRVLLLRAAASVRAASATALRRYFWVRWTSNFPYIVASSSETFNFAPSRLLSNGGGPKLA